MFHLTKETLTVTAATTCTKMLRSKVVSLFEDKDTCSQIWKPACSMVATHRIQLKIRFCAQGDGHVIIAKLPLL